MPPSKLNTHLRRNWSNYLFGILLLVLLFVPDAKSFVMRQLLHTGLFNARVEKEAVLPAANFAFTTQNGEHKQLTYLHGKLVFVNFWASWCPPCRAEFPSIISMYDKYKDHPKMAFIIINEDEDAKQGLNYLAEQRYEIPFDRLQSTIPQSMYSGTLPTTLLIDQKGTIVYRHEGFANYASRRFFEEIDTLLADSLKE